METTANSRTANRTPETPVTLPTPTFSAFIVTCRQRSETLKATLESLRACGWPGEPEIILDDETGGTPLERIFLTWRRSLALAVKSTTDFVLLLEDDVDFGRRFYENLLSWRPLYDLPAGRPFYGSLYNVHRAYYLHRPKERYLIAHPGSVWGSQAVITTPETVRYIVTHWDEETGHPDMRMPRIARRVTPIYYHVPSLVNQAKVPSTWNGTLHSAIDFDPEWHAESQAEGGSR